MTTSPRQSSPARSRPSRSPRVRISIALSRPWAKADHLQRKNLIVTAALEVLHRHGLQTVTIRRVAQRLGVGAMTLYTYFDSQNDLRHAMIERGFQMLYDGCNQASTLDTPQPWHGGAHAYLQFALKNPNLYRLMFDSPSTFSPAEHQLFVGGFQGLIDKVTARLSSRGLTGPQLKHQAARDAGRFWIALHGLASLAISNRITVLSAKTDDLLDDILAHVSPD
ncbi:MAG: TetR/AcrR family transcriptional regulator [Phycisphaeraceae bacterium]|nr:TetR/AcrR family transcriptional regulator [Phycisphaeraceae bacterium]